ncbi:MAG TPA: hypothetical protein VGS13_09475 [Stellaceae bacterium]|nr:hypothetical protein [Stellaceae bacterium]
MKHLLNGVAIAAALAIAAPAWAQAPAAPAAPSAAAPMAGAPMAPMAGKQRHKRMMRRHMTRRGAPAESTTDQLNREELARIQGAAPPPSPPLSSASPYGKGGTPK